MSDADEPIVLDAVVALHLARGDHYGIEIEQRYSLRERLIVPMISVVSAGEVMRFAQRIHASEPYEKVDLKAVEELLRTLNVTAVTGGVLRAYARLMSFAEDAGNPVTSSHYGWAAATARAHDALLVTHSPELKKFGAQVKCEIVDRSPFF